MGHPFSVLGVRLKAARERRGLSQTQLGRMSGIDEASASARITQYEGGKHWPDYATAQRLAAALGVPTALLYCDDDELATVILDWVEKRDGE